MKLKGPSAQCVNTVVTSNYAFGRWPFCCHRFTVELFLKLLKIQLHVYHTRNTLHVHITQTQLNRRPYYLSNCKVLFFGWFTYIYECDPWIEITHLSKYKSFCQEATQDARIYICKNNRGNPAWSDGCGKVLRLKLIEQRQV